MSLSVHAIDEAVHAPPGLEKPTTLVVRNLSPYCRQSHVFQELWVINLQQHADFVHVPIDYDSKYCTGICFVNFSDPAHAASARALWHGATHFGGYRCHSPGLNVCFAKDQGFDKCVSHHYKRTKYFRDSKLKFWVRPDKD